MQGVSIVGKKGESGAYGKVTKGAARGEASAPCKGRSIGKEGEKDRRRGGGTLKGCKKELHTGTNKIMMC